MKQNHRSLAIGVLEGCDLLISTKVADKLDLRSISVPRNVRMLALELKALHSTNF